MERMLEYIRKINEVNTDGVEPMTNVFSDEDNVFREDTVNKSGNREEFLMAAPACENEFFVVPKTV